MKKAITILFILGFATSLIAGDDEGYSIKFDRPVRTGEKYRLGIVSKDSMDMSFSDGMNAKKAKDDVITRLDAVMTVLEVNQKSFVEKAEYVIEKFTVESAKGKKDVIPSGRHITVTFRGKKAEFLVDGSPVDRETATLLAKNLGFFKPDMEDDAVFGTKGRRKIGDCWDMNRSLAAQKFNRDDLKLDKKDLSGSTCLKSIQKANGQDCLLIGIKMKADSFTMKNITMDRSSFDVEMDLVYPVDVQRTAVEIRMAVAVKVKGAGKLSPDTPEMLIDLNMLMNQRMKITRLK